MLESRSRKTTASEEQQTLVSTDTFVKGLQFFGTTGSAGWGKFATMFFLENGVTKSQLGMITSFQSLAKFLGYPTFGMIADYFDNSKTLLLVSLVGSNLILFLFYEPSLRSSIFANFFVLLMVRGLRSYLNAIWSLVDAVTMKLIADKKSYGKYRLFCSIAWGSSSLLCGQLVDLFDLNVIFVYGWLWSAILLAWIYFVMPSDTANYTHHKYESLSTIELTESEQQAERRQMKETPDYDFCQIFTLLKTLRTDSEFMMCLLLMLIYWCAMFIIERVIFIQMDEQFQTSKAMIGFATLCSTVPEVPVFYYSERILRRFSMNRIFGFCHIVLIIRLCLYLLCTGIDGIYIVYLAQTLHGITFSLGFTVSRYYLYELAERYSTNNEMGINVRATIQSLKGLIILTSNFVGGLTWMQLYEAYNAQIVYLAGSAVLVPSIFVLLSPKSSNTLFNTNPRTPKH